MIQIISDVLRFSKAEGIDKLILICIANYSNHDNEAWPSVKTLARDAGLAERSVHYHINHLIKIGELRKIENPQRRSNTYCIVCSQRVQEMQGRVQEMHPEGANGAPRGVQGLQTNQSDRTSHLTNKGFSLEQARLLELPDGFKTPEFLKAWDDWVANRFELGRQNNWPTTERCFQDTLKDFAKWGVERSIVAINHSIKLCYRGVFEPKTFPQTNKTPEPGFYINTLGQKVKL